MKEQNRKGKRKQVIKECELKSYKKQSLCSNPSIHIITCVICYHRMREGDRTYILSLHEYTLLGTYLTYSLTLYIWNGGFAFIWIYKWRSWASKYLLFRAVEHIETYFLSKRWREQGNVILFNPWQKELKRKELHRRVKATIRQVKMTMLLYINKNI